MKALYLLFLIICFNTGILLSQQNMKITDKQIIKSATISCSIDTAWWKWTTHEGLLTFFGADNKVELTPGGPFEIYFSKDSPEGLKGSEGCKVLSYLPGQMFTFSWNAPPSIMEARESGYYTWVVVNFKALNDGQTEVVLTHLGWPEGKLWEQVYNYFDPAWGKVMEWLANSCKK
jgi:uncharacterized protein YndB with AHSA1/START domain